MKRRAFLFCVAQLLIGRGAYSRTRLKLPLDDAIRNAEVIGTFRYCSEHLSAVVVRDEKGIEPERSGKVVHHFVTVAPITLIKGQPSRTYVIRHDHFIEGGGCYLDGGQRRWQQSSASLLFLAPHALSPTFYFIERDLPTTEFWIPVERKIRITGFQPLRRSLISAADEP